MPHRPVRPTAALVALALLASGTAALVAPAASTPSSGAAPDSFTRVDVDTAVSGAAFTVVGEVFPGEQNIITSGYGALAGGAPVGGGTVQVYRPGRDLWTWSRTTVVDADDQLVFPNRVTVADVNGDGLNDLIVPSGWFFEPDGPAKRPQGALTWWENRGLDTKGAPRAFVRHDVAPSQQASFHGVDLVDLDGDGIRDLVTTSEAGRAAHMQDDDTVTLQYLRGRADHSFESPRTLATGSGGSHPVVHDVDGDGRQDIVSAQYFGIANDELDKASFMWFERVGDSTGPLSEADFEKHTIATMGKAGHGFGIMPVPDLRAPGTTSWVGVNHQNRCFMEMIGRPGQFPAEAVMEFTPGDDVREPWAISVLSVPENPSADPMDCDDAFRDGAGTIHPSDEITSRPSPGQAGPGVFGHGDVDGDGDTDLLVSGDGDRRLFWIERVDASTTRLHTLTAPGEEFGQSGGAVVADLNGDGTNELVFSSFDKNTLALWTSRPGTPVTDPPAPRPKAATKTRATVKFAPRKRVATVRVKVTSRRADASRVDGRVRVRVMHGKKTVRTVLVKVSPRGVAVVKVPRKALRRKGVYRVVVRYTGSVTHKASRDTARFRVKRRA
ncbi:FG-GAP repeat domain-containing protein [Nocardioides jishulii]|uniref:VCBS repeat-containing protein n=1 Tax=Nocardioides jishulii TaxID=2575440 RepID=A0A4U2YTB7_9ACTN|nr:VCBS repeat-containing protein [Nocardioides jishulii]QCX28380.1 VCBS repeat-containing protein [Nocardioides jishulii]TKI64727.1 VCBS repeat-containing protein [Nocardioides jishulii]